jgi:hypothetical protein
MKYIFLILIGSICLYGCTDSTINRDRDYAEKIKTQFHENMQLEEVRQTLLKDREDIEFYNECLEQFEYPITPCEEGYNRILAIPLPGNHWWLGKGDAQFYFYFNSDQKLIEHMYELYYPRYH